MHGVALGHIAIVAVHQIALDHADGEDGQRVGVVAVGGGNISLDGVVQYKNTPAWQCPAGDFS